jgi:hypothetical protein
MFCRAIPVSQAAHGWNGTYFAPNNHLSGILLGTTAGGVGAADATPVRFVHVGVQVATTFSCGWSPALVIDRSIVLMGSGIKSVPMPRLLAAAGNVFEAVVRAELRIATKAVPLAPVEKAWNDDGKARGVFVAS